MSFSPATKIFAVILALCAILAFAQISLAHWKVNVAQTASAAQAVTASGTKTAATKVAAKATAILSDQVGRTTISGTIVMDRTDPQNPTPYISFIDQSGHTQMKQLIFSGPRGCNTTTGDLPCSAPRDINAAYPTLTDGEHVMVSGTFQDTRFIVDSISAPAP